MQTAERWTYTNELDELDHLETLSKVTESELGESTGTSSRDVWETRGQDLLRWKC
jgi:hypothetical protein